MIYQNSFAYKHFQVYSLQSQTIIEVTFDDKM